MATMPASKRAAVCAGSGSVECACEGGEKNVTRNMDACCQGLAKRGGKRVYKVYLPVGSWRKAGQGTETLREQVRKGCCATSLWLDSPVKNTKRFRCKKGEQRRGEEFERQQTAPKVEHAEVDYEIIAKPSGQTKAVTKCRGLH